MNNLGPPLNLLMQRHRRGSPDIFRKEVDPFPILCDFFRDFSIEFDGNSISEWTKPGTAHSRFILMAIWLFYEPAFAGKIDAGIKLFLRADLDRLATFVDPQQMRDDDDRGEEFVRRCLRALDMRPEGESLAHAEDRLQTLDSIEAVAVTYASREQRKRAAQVVSAMKEAAAKAAAAKVSRE